MAIQTALTRSLAIEHPIILAPMDVVADARLTAAVSAAGGLGLLGGGYGDTGWLTRELDLLAQQPVRFGVGFITWSMARQPQLLELALERKPVAIMLSFGDPAPFVDRIKSAGARLICQVQTMAMARAAVAAGADIIVAQGTEAGGHGSARGLVALVPEVVDVVGAKVPVVAAGGLADGRGLAAALMLGASGVMMGTRFYATPEAAVADAAKERVRDASGDQTARSIVFDLSRRNVWPAPFTGRCLVNDHLERWLGREMELLRELDEQMPRYLAARAAGDFDIAAVITGESAGLVLDIAGAGEVIQRIVHDAMARLATGAAYVSSGAAPAQSAGN